MPTKIFPHAQKRLVEVWLYTEENGGVDQADHYIYGLHAAFEKIAASPAEWKPVLCEGFEGVFVARYEHYYLFFRQLPSGAIGLLTVLHEKMDLPRRLKEDIGGLPS